MSDSAVDCLQLLSGLGNTVLTAVALLLALCVAVIRWKDIFRSDLRKRQLQELATVRQELHDIWFQLYYLPDTRRQMEIMGWNIDDLKVQAPERWEAYTRYSTCSLSLFYKLQSPAYFLFPRWLDPKLVEGLKSAMSDFAPFTLYSSTSPGDATRHQYMDTIRGFIDYLDRQLQRRY